MLVCRPAIAQLYSQAQLMRAARLATVISTRLILAAFTVPCIAAVGVVPVGTAAVAAHCMQWYNRKAQVPQSQQPR